MQTRDNQSIGRSLLRLVAGDVLAIDQSALTTAQMLLARRAENAGSTPSAEQARWSDDIPPRPTERYLPSGVVVVPVLGVLSQRGALLAMLLSTPR